MPVTVRLRRSTLDVWEARAAAKGVAVRTLLADRIEAASSTPPPNPGKPGR